jgi:hypothetical protein
VDPLRERRSIGRAGGVTPNTRHWQIPMPRFRDDDQAKQRLNALSLISGYWKPIVEKPSSDEEALSSF